MDPISSSSSSSNSVLENVGAEITGIVAPVSICMFLVVLLVHRLTPHGSDTPIPSVATLVYTEKASDSTSQKLEGALLNSLVFVVMISMVTFLLVLLYYFRCIKFLKYYMCVSAAMVLAYMGGAVSLQLIEALTINIDIFTFAVFLFNFTVVGVLAVFMTSMPILITQFYLVMIGMLVAFWFTMLPEWTTWTLLVAMALYDLVAVLAPGGPLKLLVELAISRDEDIPALIYESRPVSVVNTSVHNGNGVSTRRWRREAPRNDAPSTEMQPLDTTLDVIATQTDTFTPAPSASSPGGTHGRIDLQMPMRLDPVQPDHLHTHDEIVNIEDCSAETPPTSTNHRHDECNPHNEIKNAEDKLIQSLPRIPGNMHSRYNAHEEIEDAEDELMPLMNTSHLSPVPNRTPAADVQESAQVMGQDDEDGVYGFGLSTSGALKLGLGDFVFYSLLVGRAAMYDLMTVYACYLAIIAGLGSTLVLLAVARRALPALPISIGLGVIFYLLTRLLMEPLVVGLSTSLVMF